VCLYINNTRQELDALVRATVAWATGIVWEERAELGGMSSVDPRRGGFLEMIVDLAIFIQYLGSAPYSSHGSITSKHPLCAERS
jgi:hypothetical protein